jgi:ADP-L-glycero-D-manno-heptose 6-epimerase
VKLWFFDHPHKSGLFNLGSGRAQPFNDVAVAMVNALQGTQHDLAALVAQRKIEYVEFPQTLVGKYQCFTEADLTRLREAGCELPFASVGEGVRAYAAQLQAQAG